MGFRIDKLKLHSGHQDYPVLYASDNERFVGQNQHGWFRIGAANSSHLHMETDRENFYFYNSIQNAVNIKAPIYYDISNTAYYVDPASTSNLHTLTMAGNLTVNGKVYLDSSGSGAYGGAIEIRETAKGGSLTGAWNDSPGISFHWGGRVAKRFGVRADGQFAVDDSPIALQSWVDTNFLRTTEKAADSNLLDGIDSTQFMRSDITDTFFLGQTSALAVENQGTFTRLAFNELRFYEWDSGGDNLILNNGYVSSDSSFRAPIFYDSDNTGYYLNPASTSKLNAVRTESLGVNTGSSQTNKNGLSLYGATSGGEPTYGMMFTGTAGSGTHGAVTSDWATYFTMNNANNRGWIFRRVGSGNSASISAAGAATFDSYVRSDKFYDTHNTNSWLDIRDTSGNYHLKAVEGGMYFDAPIFYFRDYSDGNQRFTIDAGIGTATSSLRAPIFYDSNNTGYYVNPAGTSRLGYAHFDGYSDTSGNARTTTGVSLGRYTSEYAHIDIASSHGSGGWIDFSDASGGDYGGRIRYHNSSEYMSFYAGGTNEEFRINSSYTTSLGSSRAPVFYDNDNTNYFLNPASTSRLNLLTDYRGNYATHHIQSGSDFANGTLVTTNINANVTNGDSYIIEVTGKSYSSNSEPFSWIGQGYLYNNTIISHSAISQTGIAPDYMKVFKHSDDKLAFWWPRYSYWNSFEVRVRRASGNSAAYNAVTSIVNSAEPSSDKKVQTNIAKVWTRNSLQNLSQLTNDSGYLTSLPSHTHPYLPLTGGSLTGPLNVAGNVGIGTTSPDYKLDISDSSSGNGQIALRNTGSGTAGIWFDASNGDIVGSDYAWIRQNNDLTFEIGVDSLGGDMLFTEGGSERMRISSGNVGIGTTSPQAKLEVQGSAPFIYITDDTETESGIIFRDLQAGLGQAAAIKFSSADNKLRFYNNDTVAVRMTINTNGNVGIGETDPTNKLHVGGSIKWEGASTEGILSGSELDVSIAAQGSVPLILSANGNGVLLLDPNDYVYKLGDYEGDNNGSYLEIEDDGQLATFYNLDLDVQGNVYAEGSMRATALYDVNNTSYYVNPNSTSNMVSIQTTSGNSFISKLSGTKSWLKHITTGALVFAPSASNNGSDWSWANEIRLSSNGTITSNGHITRSDERLKTKITDLPCDNIDVAWKSYELKSDEGEKRVGVIAQELEETHPEFVITDSEGFKSVKYIDLLIAKIAELEARLQKLEN
ncbi:tail fiber domain-containing protein [Polaribacter sp.]|nr:tail fiber domain-containing protein [Polaribacter sp.]